MMQRFQLNLSIAWRMSSHIQGCGHVCAGIKQTFICKRLLFWPGFQIGYWGLLPLSSASLFTVCKSSIRICEQRLSLFCYFCSGTGQPVLFYLSLKLCRCLHLNCLYENDKTVHHNTKTKFQLLISVLAFD